MNTAVENDIRKLRVIGTAGVAARLGLRATDPARPIRLVPAASRTHRVRGELVTLPHVVGVANRPLRSTATVHAEQVAPAA